jgi:ABC-type transporter Mla subunit MlaD
MADATLDQIQSLLSAAVQRLDQVSQQQQTFQGQVSELGIQIEELATVQAHSQRQIDALINAQTRTQQQLDALTVRVQAVSDRVDSFVSASQHYFSQHGERLAKLEGIAERLEGILAYLVRKDDKKGG